MPTETTMAHGLGVLTHDTQTHTHCWCQGSCSCVVSTWSDKVDAGGEKQQAADKDLENRNPKPDATEAIGSRFRCQFNTSAAPNEFRTINRTIYINENVRPTFVVRLNGILTMREDSSSLHRSTTKKELGGRRQDTPVPQKTRSSSTSATASYQAALG